MIADCLTKLATNAVIQVLLDAMDGVFPERTVEQQDSGARRAEHQGSEQGAVKQDHHRTSVSPGPWNRGDIAGDGPAPWRTVSVSGSQSGGRPSDRLLDQGSSGGQPSDGRRDAASSSSALKPGAEFSGGGRRGSAYDSPTIRRVINSWSGEPVPDRTMSLKTAVIEYPMMCPNLDNDDPLWEDVFTTLYAKYSPDKLDKVPALCKKYGATKRDWYAMFVKAHLLSNNQLRSTLGRFLQEQTSEVTDDQQVTATIPDSDEEEYHEDNDDPQEQAPPGAPAKKRRRGKKRCRPGANDRRAAKAQKAQDDSQRQSTAAAAGAAAGGST